MSDSCRHLAPVSLGFCPEGGRADDLAGIGGGGGGVEDDAALLDESEDVEEEEEEDVPEMLEDVLLALLWPLLRAAPAETGPFMAE